MVGGNRVSLFRIILAVMLAMPMWSVQAQALSKPKEFYFDADVTTARRIVVVEGEGEALAAGLVKARERGRRQVEATAQLAHVALSDRRTELGKSLYEQAVSGSALNSSVGRSVRWNYGWDLYRAGDASGALAQWAVLAEPGPIRGEWLPTTLAMALWKLDRKDEAVKWYAAAVRTYPDRWSSPADIAALLPDWREEDRATLIEVQRAWAANPPTWP